jgi:hypothetical protein
MAFSGPKGEGCVAFSSDDVQQPAARCVTSEAGGIVKRSGEAPVGTSVRIRLAEGRLGAEVKSTEYGGILIAKQAPGAAHDETV